MNIRVFNRYYSTRYRQEKWNLAAYDYEATKEINVIPTITFNVAKDADGHYKGLETEGYIISDDGRFVVKEIETTRSELSVYASYDVEAFTSWHHQTGVSTTGTLGEQIEAILSYASISDEWIVNHYIPEGIDKQSHTISWNDYTDNATLWDDFLTVIDTFDAEFVMDNVNNVIDLYEERHCGEDIGAYVLDGFNLSDYTVEENAEDIVTVLYPYGKDGLTIESVNPTGLDHISDFTYIGKSIRATWTDESYTDATSLYNAAVSLLAEKCKPVLSYTLTVGTLSLIADNDTFSIGLGDTVRLSIDGVESSQTVVKIVEKEDDPLNTSISLSSVQSSLTDRIAGMSSVSSSSSGGGSISTVAWSAITGKPTTFTPSAHTHTTDDITDFDTEMATKQDKLVSGTNIKTVNGYSVLGSGNIEISGGSSSPSAITVNGSASSLSSSAGTQTKIVLNTIVAQTTQGQTDFTVSDGAVVCNKAGYLEISASCDSKCNSGTANRCGTYIRKNWVSTSSLGDELVANYRYQYSTNEGAVPTATKIIEVAEGDKITLHGRTSVAGTLYPSNASTFLSLKFL